MYMPLLQCNVRPASVGDATGYSTVNNSSTTQYNIISSMTKSQDHMIQYALHHSNSIPNTTATCILIACDHLRAKQLTHAHSATYAAMSGAKRTSAFVRSYVSRKASKRVNYTFLFRFEENLLRY